MHHSHYALALRSDRPSEPSGPSSHRRRFRPLAGLVGLVLVAMLAAGCGDKPAGNFPAEPSPRDGLVIRYMPDVSCDALPISGEQQRSLINALLTQAAWHEGVFSAAALRNNAILNLNFRTIRFASQKDSPEAIRRDLQAQRDRVSISGLVDHLRASRTGPCRTDLLAAFGEIQRSLSGSGAGTRPVVVVAVTNGLVVARNIDFYDPQPAPDVRLAELKRAGEIARLPGVKLFLVGIGRARGVGLRKARWLEEFWIGYARAAGAEPVLVRSIDELIARLGGAA